MSKYLGKIYYAYLCWAVLPFMIQGIPQIFSFTFEPTHTGGIQIDLCNAISLNFYQFIGVTGFTTNPYIVSH